MMTYDNVIDLEKFRNRKKEEEEKSLMEVMDYINSLDLDTITLDVDEKWPVMDMSDFYNINLHVNLDLGDDDGS